MMITFIDKPCAFFTLSSADHSQQLEDGKVKGFYLVGYLTTGCKAKFGLNSIREKPFIIDAIEGTIEPKCQPTMEKRRNVWTSDWHFIKNHSISDIDKDKELREFINGIWEGWCEKHHRKYEPILEK